MSHIKAQRDLIRFAARECRKDFITFIRHIASDHYRVAQMGASQMVRDAAKTLHAMMERLIDLIEEGYFQAIFQNKTLMAVSTRAAHAVLKRAK